MEIFLRIWSSNMLISTTIARNLTLNISNSLSKESWDQCRVSIIDKKIFSASSYRYIILPINPVFNLKEL